MPRERNGERKPRKSLSKRKPDLGYYFIATDATETEKNYIIGLRDSLPKELQNRIVIKVSTTEIIKEAESKDIKVGWSNPCIEIWFAAYFGKIPAVQESVACWKGFAEQFVKIAGYTYKKSDQKIYATLNKLGKEKNAIEIAERRYQAHLRNGVLKPSQMCPCTTVHHLVDEIRKKCIQ